MTDQTSETTPDGLDVAAVRDALSALDEHLEAVQTFATMAPVGDHGDTRWGEGYKRASEHEINALAPIVETLRTDIPLLLAALDEAEFHIRQLTEARDRAERIAEAAEVRLDTCVHSWHDGRSAGPCPSCGYLRPQDRALATADADATEGEA